MAKCLVQHYPYFGLFNGDLQQSSMEPKYFHFCLPAFNHMVFLSNVHYQDGDKNHPPKYFYTSKLLYSTW